MGLITNYATLQTEVARILNRGDLTNDIPGFIQDLESRLKDDPRARKLATRSPLAVGADGVQLPTDFMEIDTLYHDGPNYYDRIEIVAPGDLPQWKLEYGPTGVPAYAAVEEGSPPSLRFAPSPDGSFSLRLTYFRTITDLSASNTTNWLLLERPDIYKFGACVSAAPFLKNDERLAVWEGIYNQRLDELSIATERKRYAGGQRRQVRPFGE